MKFLYRINAIAFKEVKQLSRDHLTFAMIVMIPIIQLTLFGYAINTKITHIPVGLVDLSHTTISRMLTQTVAATKVVTFKHAYNSIPAAEQAITRGQIRAAFILEKDTPARYVQARMYKPLKNHSQFNTEIRPIGQWLVDGTDTIIASAIKGLRNMPLPEIDVYSTELNRTVPTFEVAEFYNPEQRTAINIVPGLVGIILTMTMVMFTSAAIVRERERGNLEFLISTPVRPMELMLGKIIPYIFIGLIQSSLILGLGHLLFAIPISGSLLSIFTVCLLFIFTSLTLGLLISTKTKTQLQAMQLTIFILLPSILLSGFIFPYESMPQLAQNIAEILPVTHFMRMIRAVVLKGAKLSDLTSDIIWNIGFIAIILTLAATQFRKSLD